MMASIICSSNPTIIRKPSQFHTFGSRNLHRTCKFPLRISHAHAIKASINQPFVVKAIESDRLPPDVKKKTMDALDACGGFKVTVGDVSGKAGIDLHEAEKALQALAADTDGFMEVSDEGDILYVFSTYYRSKLEAKILVDKFTTKVDNIVRVSCGPMLVASTVIVFITIIAIFILAKSEDDGNDGDRDSDSAFLLWDHSSDDKRHEKSIPKAGVETKNDQRMNFMKSVCSFVFGDRGGQGEGNEEKRWKLIGRYISSKGGVVTAEELLPFLDLPVIGKMNSYILQVLLRFDGQPVVDGIGNILYSFPSLQRTTRAKKIEAGGFEIEKFFIEKKWEFSKTTTQDRVLIIGLAGFNLLEVGYLGNLLTSPTVSAIPSRFIPTIPSRFIPFISAIFSLLQISAASFFVVPLVRWLYIMKTNSEIEKRNQVREECARIIQSPDDTLRMKLRNAQDISRRMGSKI